MTDYVLRIRSNITFLAAAGSVVVAGLSATLTYDSGSEFDPPDIMSHDFEDGLLAPFTDPFEDGSVAVVNDPTGLFGGKVMRVNYDINPGGADHQDLNRFIEGNVSALDIIHFFFRGYLCIRTPTGNDPFVSRKLLYMQSTGYPVSGWAVVLGADDWGAGDRNELSTSYGEVTFFPEPHDFNLDFDVKYCVEMEIKRNSADGVADGLVRVWIDGALIAERLSIEINGPEEPMEFIRSMQIGDQVDRFDAADDVIEMRCWDNCALSTTRIGP